jgi:ribonuclease HI
MEGNGKKTTLGNNAKKKIWKTVISEEDEYTTDGGGYSGEGGEDNGDDENGGYQITTTTNNQNNTSKHPNTKHDKAQQILLGLQYLINSTVLFTREHLKAGDRIDDVARLICNSTVARIAHLAPMVLTRTALPGNRFTEEDLKKFAKKVKSFGASGKRTQEQATAAAAHAASLVSSLPSNSIQIWSKSSKTSKGARGPTGAGALIKETGNEIPTHRLAYHLGDSTNQVAEIWAIGGALETMRWDNGAENKDIHVFSDSDFAIKCITGISTSRAHQDIVKHVTALVAFFPKNSVKFHHIAGHAGITDNDAAGALAREGAGNSERLHNSHDFPYIAKSFGFNHQLVNSNCCCNGNLNCKYCTDGKDINTDSPTSDSRIGQRIRSNSISSIYSNNSDDSSEESILPTVFGEGPTVCGSSLIFNK